MFNSLSGADHAGIQDLLVLYLFNVLLGFGDDAFDCLALLAAGGDVQGLEHLIQPVHLAFRFQAVGFERLLEFRTGGFLDHPGQRFEDLLLCVVDVFEGGDEQVVHGFDGHRRLLRFGLCTINPQSRA